jgi:hypothetical protein
MFVRREDEVVTLRVYILLVLVTVVRIVSAPVRVSEFFYLLSCAPEDALCCVLSVR